MSIIKVKAIGFMCASAEFSGRFSGTLISCGVYFGFDWNGRIVNLTKANAAGNF